MRRMSIKWLLMTLGIASIIGASLTLVLLYIQQQRMVGHLETISNVDGPLLFHLQDVYAQGLQTEQATRNVILNPKDQKARDNFKNADTQFREALTAARALARGEMARTLDGIKPKWDASHALKLQLMDMAVAGNTDMAVTMLNSEETPLWRAIKQTILECVSAQQEVSKANLAAIEASEATVFRMFLAMAIGSVVLLLFLIGSMIRGVRHGADAIITYARAIGGATFPKSRRPGCPGNSTSWPDRCWRWSTTWSIPWATTRASSGAWPRPSWWWTPRKTFS